MLARDDVEAVIVASPDQFHAQHTMAAARAGKAILCQKPLALNLEQAAAVRAVLAATQVYFSAAQSFRYEAAARQAQGLITAGEIGEPVYASYSVKGRFYPYPPDSFYRRAESGGQFLHNGMHYVDLLSCLLASLPTRVYGQSLGHYPTDDRLATDNYTMSVLDFASGALGRVEQNLTMLEPSGYPTRQETRVVGTRGALTYGGAAGPALEVFGEDGYQALSPESVPPEQQPFVLLTRDFVYAALREQPPVVPAEHSFRVLEACLGTLESCRTGQPVELGKLDPPA